MMANHAVLRDRSTDEIGGALGLVGAVACVAYPVYYALVVYDGTTVPADPGKLLVLVGACVAVWGGGIVRSGRLRPLTPARSLLIPATVVAVSVAMDAATVGRVFEIFGEGYSAGLVVAKLSAALPAVTIGASVFPVVGSAVRRRQYEWIAAGVALVLVAFAFASRPNTQGMALLVTAVGLPVAAFGSLVGDRE